VSYPLLVEMRVGRLSTLLLLSSLVQVGCPGPIENPEPTAPPRDEIVVLLHGIARSSHSMWRIETALRNQGYEVVNHDYPSTEKSIDELSDLLGQTLATCCDDPDRQVHFVTHSMGGIVVRYHLAQHDLPNLGRVVMLSPPSAGSEMVDVLGDNPLFELTMGPAGRELGTDPASVPRKLGPVDFELGVITGNSSINPIFSEVIPGLDDGAVSVESARTPGMADFIVLPYSHTFIMLSREVIEQIVYFLENGVFDHRENAS
jgi:pimeloyl-ACP methyl ester carboxylesterase